MIIGNCNDIEAIDNYMIFITNMLSVTTLTKSYQESIEITSNTQNWREMLIYTEEVLHKVKLNCKSDYLNLAEMEKSQRYIFQI